MRCRVIVVVLPERTVGRVYYLRLDCSVFCGKRGEGVDFGFKQAICSLKINNQAFLFVYSLATPQGRALEISLNIPVPASVEEK